MSGLRIPSGPGNFPFGNSRINLGVAKLIRELPNGIRKPDMLIDVEGTAKCLALIYKGALDKGKLPRQWKSANVTPIHKGGAIVCR